MFEKSTARQGRLSVTFAGQAGFIFHTADGLKIGVDLYLSDCCNRYFGFKRLLPYLFEPLGLDLDMLFATHAHYDHFDPDSVPLIMSNARTELVCAYDVKPEAQRLGLDEKRITYIRSGDVLERQGITVKAIPCDHGKDTPDAVGLLLEIDSRRIYITGDTAFRKDFFANTELHNCDLLIMPINGAFGNMNESEGAQASRLLSPKLTVPCHYWNFSEHGGNPALFAEAVNALPQRQKYLLMRPGETVYI